MNFKDIHVILIGYNRVESYKLQLDIIRKNWPKGEDIWITAVHNGPHDWLTPGVYGENTFIRLEENKGYGLGALDAINAGLDYALHHNREIVILTNFDSGFFTQKGMEKVIDEFCESNKAFCAGEDVHHIPVTDGLIFKKETIEKIFPILPEVDETRKQDEFLQKEYEGTLLSFMNMEEIFYNALIKAGVQESWLKMDRGEPPRCRFSFENTFWHIHEPEDLHKLCIDYGIVHGVRVQRLLSYNNLEYFNVNVYENPNVIEGIENV